MLTKLIPNFIRNTDAIVDALETYQELFVPRVDADSHEGFIPGLKSKFSTLHHTEMSESFIQLLFKDSDFDQYTRDFYSFIQIQRYLPGDYIVWHHDSYHVTKLHLVTLTTSDSDGLCVAENGIIRKVYDKAGQYIDFPYEAPHAVEVVRDRRYSLVIGM